MPKGFTESEKALIRERLLTAGEALFSLHGLKKTSVAELAAAAHISSGAFYLFYASKEALFMEVVEQIEARIRQEILALIDQPGPTPRARLLAVLRHAFALLKTFPLLKMLTSSDYDQLVRRLPAAKLGSHFASDERFFAELVARCHAAGIPLRAEVAAFNLLYPLVLAALHSNEYTPPGFSASIDTLLDLIAGYCLGES